VICQKGDQAPYVKWLERQVEIHGDNEERYEYDLEEIREDYVSLSYGGTGITLPHDSQDWTILNGHPLVALMRIVIWNANTTCTPLQTMNDFEEFFAIYDERVSKTKKLQYYYSN